MTEIFEPRIEIVLEDDRQRYFAGETVRGTVEIALDEDVSLSKVSLVYQCIGEVKWVEHPATPYYLNGFVYYDKYSYHKQQAKLADADQILPKNQKSSIPFEFEIPKNKGIPSTMVSAHGFVQHLIQLQIESSDRLWKIVKELIIESPPEENLLITVGSSAEKSVLLHPGKVWMHATVNRKGYAPGETIDIHITVNNGCQAQTVPRVSLYQVQIYMCGTRHKTIQNILNDTPVIGEPVEPGKESTQVLALKIPVEESLTIKSSVITVKYFVHTTLAIPHALDLHINLPIVLTSSRVMKELLHNADQAETPQAISQT